MTTHAHRAHDRHEPEGVGMTALTGDETEALYAALILHGDFQEDCDEHPEFDCRRDVYAVVERIIAAREVTATPANVPEWTACDGRPCRACMTTADPRATAREDGGES